MNLNDVYAANPVTTLTGTELLYLVQSGVDAGMEVSAILDYITASLPILDKVTTGVDFNESEKTLTLTLADESTLTTVINNRYSIAYACSDQTTAITTGQKMSDRLGTAFTVVSVTASLATAQTSGALFTIDVKKNGTSIFSTLLTFDNTEDTTTTAATPAVLSADTFAADDKITIHVTQVGDGTAIGLVVRLNGFST